MTKGFSCGIDTPDEETENCLETSVKNVENNHKTLITVTSFLDVQDQ